MHLYINAFVGWCWANHLKCFLWNYIQNLWHILFKNRFKDGKDLSSWILEIMDGFYILSLIDILILWNELCIKIIINAEEINSVGFICDFKAYMLLGIRHLQFFSLDFDMYFCIGPDTYIFILTTTFFRNTLLNFPQKKRMNVYHSKCEAWCSVEIFYVFMMFSELVCLSKFRCWPLSS